MKVFVVALTIFLTSAVVASQSDSVDAIAPVRSISLDWRGIPFDVQFAPDGRLAYCIVDTSSIDLLDAALTQSSVALGAMLLVVLAFATLRAVRVLRRPQIAGSFYCGRCAYNLEGHLSGWRSGSEQNLDTMRCPECGTLLADKQPRCGRTSFNRLRVPVLSLLACGMFYLGVLYLNNAGVRPFPRANLWSSAVDRFAERLQIQWLLQHRVPVCRLFAIDLDSGSIGPPLQTIRGRALGGVFISPDGNHLAVAAADGDVLWIESSSGRRVASTDHRSQRRASGVVGIDGRPSDFHIYYAAIDDQRRTSSLIRWHPAGGQQETVIEESMGSSTAGPGEPIFTPRSYALLHQGDGLVILSSLGSPHIHDGRVRRFTVYGISQDRPPEKQEIPETFARIGPLVMHPNAAAAFFSAGQTTVYGYDFDTGRPMFMIELGRREYTANALAISADGRHLFVATFSASILIWDFGANRVVKRLCAPTPFNGPAFSLDPKGRWVAGFPHRTPAGDGPHDRDVLLFDLHAARRSDDPRVDSTHQ